MLAHVYAPHQTRERASTHSPTIGVITTLSLSLSAPYVILAAHLRSALCRHYEDSTPTSCSRNCRCRQRPTVSFVLLLSGVLLRAMAARGRQLATAVQ